MKEFFTREAANEGIKLPLFHPDGTASEHWLIVRGIDSDQFRRAESAAKRRAIEFAQIEDIQKRAEEVRSAELECIAALVADWSFPQELTVDNVVMFFREAPQIADEVNRFAARRIDYFRKKSNPSAAGTETKSNSPKSRKTPKSATETT